MNKCKVDYFDGVLTVRFSKKIKSGWEQWFMLSSDRHHDDIYCNREHEKRDLDLAVKRDAYILDFGDMFSLMEGKYDPRRSYDNLRPEYKTDSYIDSVVDQSAEDYRPYAKHFLYIGSGNHEESVRRKNGTDPKTRVVQKLQDMGSPVVAGGYGGWIRFMFTTGSNTAITKRLYQHHGSGGSAPVTKGVIDASRQAIYLSNADIVVNGHNHNQYILPVRRMGLNQAGHVETGTMIFVRTPGYKDLSGMDKESISWEVSSGHPPKPVGCVWMRFFSEGDNIKMSFTLDV